MWKSRFIVFLFVSLLLANLGHNTIPHHHHYDSAVSHQGCNEYDGENSFQAGDPNHHCHAFNGIEYFPGPDKNKLNRPRK